MVQLKHLSNFWSNFEMPLVVKYLALTWSAKCVLSDALNQESTDTFAIIDKKPYVSVGSLLTRDNAKLLQQVNSGFKRTINWNKYQSKASAE